MKLPVAILAGGLATRLRPITEKIPKALVPVAGQPFIDHQLALLRANGCRHVVLCLGYLGEMVREHLGEGESSGMRIEYVFDGPNLLGTAGALRAALPRLGKAFLVLYGDSYLPCPYGEVEEAFLRSGMPGLMSVYCNDNRWDRSNVVLLEGRIIRYDKRRQTADMRYIDYGLGALRASVLQRYPEENIRDLAEIYAKLVAEGELAGFEVKERFYEIGSPAGLAETEQYLIANKKNGKPA